MVADLRVFADHDGPRGWKSILVVQRMEVVIHDFHEPADPSGPADRDLRYGLEGRTGADPSAFGDRDLSATMRVQLDGCFEGIENRVTVDPYRSAAMDPDVAKDGDGFSESQPSAKHE